MKILFLLIFATSISHAAPVDLEDYAKKNGIALKELLLPSAVDFSKASAKNTVVIDGPQKIRALNKKDDTWLLYTSRIVYFTKDAESVSRAVNPVVRKSNPPAPITKVSDLKEVSPLEYIYRVINRISKMGIDIDMTCQATTNTESQPDMLLVQNYIENCVDVDKADKVWVIETLQNNQIVSLDKFTALVMQNISISKRNRIAIIKPSPEMMLEIAVETGDRSLEDIKRFLGVKN